MKVRLLTLALIFSISGSSYVFSQDNPLEPGRPTSPIYVGPVAGYNLSMHSTDLTTFMDNLCPKFENGAANGFFAGLSAEYLIGNVANSKSSIIAKVLYNSLPVSLEVAGKEYPSRVINAETGEELLVNSSTEFINEVTYNVLTLETFYKLNLLNTPLGVFVGPTFDFAISADQNKTMNLIKPDNARFQRNEDNTDIIGYSNNDRTIIMADGPIEESNAFRLGIKAGLQYEISMAKFFIVPHVSYNYGITDLSTGEDWRVDALQFGIDLRYALNLF